MSGETDVLHDVRTSVASGEPTSAFWERAHAAEKRLWISGTDPLEIWARLTVMPLLRPGARVLNIGVGTGACTRALATGGMAVSVLDISRTALEKVKDVAGGWLASELEAIPSRIFDVALSHLVAQHMNNADLERQMRAVFRALKLGGIFAIHYVESFDGEDTHNETDEGVRAGGVLRSPAFFATMVQRSGGKVVWDQPREKWGATWRVAHLTPAG